MTLDAGRTFTDADDVDDDAVAWSVAADRRDELVRLAFTARLSWFAMPADTARALARLLERAAAQVDRVGKPI